MTTFMSGKRSDMKISPSLRSNINKILLITSFYVLINWFFTFYNHVMLTSEFSLGRSDFYDLGMNLWANTLTGIFAGLLGGSTLIYVNDKIFRKRSYGHALIVTFLYYTLAYLIISLLMSTLGALIVVGVDAPFAEIIARASIYWKSKLFWVFYTIWGMVSVFTLFLLQMSDKFGTGMFLKFIAGQYNQPREETRIFMFLDLKSSTTIAEKLGNTKYFHLLQELFTDVTDPILASAGEIYQYVGDEIVISWSLKNGIKNANCFRCFLEIKKHLKEVSAYYENVYEIIPEFKAGLHYGKVTAGEIGTIKKDIVYSGDVLNTTSRIQEQCNAYRVELLVSDQTLNLLDEPLPYEVIELGDIELRGKTEKIDLKTLNLEETPT